MSTGIRILPRDTAGYLFDGTPVSYQIARSMQEYYAKNYPEARAQMARDAEAINGVHLRRLLSRATWGKRDERFGIENMPRALRRAWHRSGLLTCKNVAATDEYVLAMDKNRRAIAKWLAAMPK